MSSQSFQAYIAAENPDTGEVEVLALGQSTSWHAGQFVSYLNENPVNEWSGDTPAQILLARHPQQVLDYLALSFQAPCRRGAVLVNIAGPEWHAPAPFPR